MVTSCKFFIFLARDKIIHANWTSVWDCLSSVPNFTLDHINFSFRESLADFACFFAQIYKLLISHVVNIGTVGILWSLRFTLLDCALEHAIFFALNWSPTWALHGHHHKQLLFCSSFSLHFLHLHWHYQLFLVVICSLLSIRLRRFGFWRIIFRCFLTTVFQLCIFLEALLFQCQNFCFQISIVFS